MKILAVRDNISNQYNKYNHSNKYVSVQNNINRISNSTNCSPLTNINFTGVKEYFNAIEEGDLHTVIFEVSNGVNVNTQDEDGWTGLDNAVLNYCETPNNKRNKAIREAYLKIIRFLVPRVDPNELQKSKAYAEARFSFPPGIFSLPSVNE